MAKVETPWSVRIATALTGLAALALAGIGVATIVARPDALSVGVAAVLLVWAAVCAVGARGLLRGRAWARGPVVAAGLLHAASCASFVGSQPWAVVPALLAICAVGAAVHPATTRFLHLD